MDVLIAPVEPGAEIREGGDAGNGLHLHVLYEGMELGGAGVKAHVPREEHRRVPGKVGDGLGDVLRADEGFALSGMVGKGGQHPRRAHDLAGGGNGLLPCQGEGIGVSHADPHKITSFHGR